LFAAKLYWLVSQVLPTRPQELLRAVTPGLLLGALLFAFLAAIDYVTGAWARDRPVLYLVAMSASGGLFSASTFVLLPLRMLESESERWRKLLADILTFFRLRRG
jgi:TRAP-type C4-dicarboxylate transport system permease small subunit